MTDTSRDWDPTLKAQLIEREDELRKLVAENIQHEVPTTPGRYIDGSGDPWRLDEHGHWFDKHDETRDPEWNWMLVRIGPWTAAK